jgi:hypothetical protein
MKFLLFIGFIYSLFIINIFLKNRPQKYITRFTEKQPKLSFLIFVVLIITIYQALLSFGGYQGNSRYEDRPTDCEYDAYHGWSCN